MNIFLTKKAINIHTIEFSYPYVSVEDHKRLLEVLVPEKQNRTNSEMKIYKGNSQSKEIRYEYLIINKSGFKNRILKAIVNPSKVLNKEELLPEDLEPFLRKYNFLKKQELSFETLESEIFSRIDYYIDSQFEPIIKDTLLKIYNKAPSYYKGLERKNKYKSSVHYISKSRQINIYSRYQKIVNMILKDNYINPDIVDVKNEIEPFISQKDKNTLRFEVQIKRKKIMYYLHKDGTCPELINYWNYRDAAYYINDVLKPIIHNGDYYNCYHAKKKLMEYYGNKKLVDRIIKFQNSLSNYGYDKAKAEFPNYNKYINYLLEAGVNPYPIPNNTGITYIKNPIKFFDKSTDAYRIPDEEWTGLININQTLENRKINE